jgi:hypothetical protein
VLLAYSGRPIEEVDCPRVPGSGHVLEPELKLELVQVPTVAEGRHAQITQNRHRRG